MTLKSVTWSGITPEIKAAALKEIERLEQEIYGAKVETWVTRQPVDKKKDLYEFTENQQLMAKIRALKVKGEYKVIHAGYKYWFMKGGMGRRKIPP